MEDSLPALLKKYNLFPRKGLGQNFLADPFHLAKIIEAAQLSQSDTVLEIGPGPGTLTRRLVEAAGRVIAVELDTGMIDLLQNELGHYPNLTLVEADILTVSLDSILPVAAPQQPKIGQYKVVANLPYYITSAVLRHLLEATPPPTRLVVTVQKEVAQRIVAGPGDMSVLAVSVQLYGQPQVVHRIPAGAFYPPPNVDSALLRVDTHPSLPIPVADVDHFFKVVKAGFSQKRKQLKNSLAGGLGQPAQEISTALEQAAINPTRRAETLSLEEWGRLAALLSAEQ